MGREVLNYFACVAITCVYIGQPLVTAATRIHPMLNSVAVLAKSRRLTMIRVQQDCRR